MTADGNRVASARELALRYLDRRMYSRFALSSRLLRKGFDEETTTAALDAVEAAGFVDDRAFARAFVRDRVRLHPRGYRLIAQELRSQGVDREIAEEAVGEVEEETPELTLARELAARRRLDRGSTPLERRARLTRFLRGRGFRGETINRLWHELAAGEAHVEEAEY